MVCSNGKNSTFTIQPHGLSENTPNDCSTLEKTILKSLGTLMRSSPSLLLLSLPSLLEWSSLFANPSDRLNATSFLWVLQDRQLKISLQVDRQTFSSSSWVYLVMCCLRLIALCARKNFWWILIYKMLYQ